MSKQREHDDSKEKSDAQYCKAEEHTVSTYEEADALATSLYAAFVTKSDTDSSGESTERTCESAKVRVRRRTGSHGRPDSFRVTVSKRIRASTKEAEPTITEEATDASTNGTKELTKSERRAQVKSSRAKSKTARR